MTPQRIHRQRAKGWRMPPNTRSVTRPGRFGNPFYIINEEGSPWISDHRDKSMPVLNDVAAELLGLRLGERGDFFGWDEAERGVVELFKCEVLPTLPVEELRGMNLACFCKLDCPCHADVLLEAANRRTQ